VGNCVRALVGDDVAGLGAERDQALVRRIRGAIKYSYQSTAQAQLPRSSLADHGSRRTRGEGPGRARSLAQVRAELPRRYSMLLRPADG
jgi:hypothetical protein